MAPIQKWNFLTLVVRKTASESTEQEHSTNRPQIHTATRTSEGMHTGAMCGCMPPATWSARMRARSASQLGQKFAFDRDGSKDRRSYVTPTGTAFFIHGRDSGSYTHVQRARVTVRVNAGVHRTFGRHLAQESRRKKKGYII